jgi:diguanylate cyclase (GGDEF)-like protein
MSRAKSLFRVRGLLLVLLPVTVVAVAVMASSSLQRSTEQRAFNHVEDSQQLLMAWLDRANALRVFLNTGSPAALDASERLVGPYRTAAQTARTDVRGVPGASAVLAREIQSAQRWQSWSLVAAAQIRRHGVRPLSLAITKPRSNAGAAFQAANERLTALMMGQRKSDIASAARIGDGILGLAFLILALAAVAVARARRNRDARAVADERAYVEGRRRLSQVLLAAETPAEACQLAKAAIESRVPGSAVVALKCSHDADGLALLTAAPQSLELARALDDAKPRSCLAIRLGAAQTSEPTEPSNVVCELCGRGGYALCEPLLAGGEITGSMLITHRAPLSAPERRAIGDTVAYITPVLANLTNLAQAQNRAQTDALTELPNRRALDAMLKGMFAQANRTGTSLSLALVDVDHFKEVNDTFGHDCGDELLLTVATALAQSVRASDFVARLGGDEFVVALPATDLDGASHVAQKLGAAARNARVLGFSWEITASLGIASYPDHGSNVEAVMRSADTALYEAKKDGRDCIRHAPVISPAPPALTPT